MPPDPKATRPETKPRFPLQPPWGGQQHEPGWKVDPAADGRGAPPPRSRMPRLRFWPLLIFLLVINYWVVSTLPDKPARAHISYSPQFLHEVRGANVSQVTITDQ